jgi:membrane protein CcdC involved in cytochrome C biogenesis
MFWGIASTVVALIMATIMIVVRLKMTKKPTSVKKIILPPFFMSTGALMFIFPVFRISWIEAAEAFFLGVLFSILLIKSSKLEVRNQEIYLNASKAFPFILIGLLIVRLILKIIVGSQISLGETAGVFFILAFGMLLTWRIVMLYKYSQLNKSLENKLNREIQT